MWPGHGLVVNSVHRQIAERFANVGGYQWWNPAIVCWGLGGFGLWLTGPTEVYAVLTRRNLIKMVMGLSMMEASTYLFMLSLAYRAGSTAPVLTGPPPGKTMQDLVHGNVADPCCRASA